jgi:hypothetical protein
MTKTDSIFLIGLPKPLLIVLINTNQKRIPIMTFTVDLVLKDDFPQDNRIFLTYTLK